MSVTVPPIVPPVITVPDGAAKVEQTAQGTKAPPTLVTSFEFVNNGKQIAIVAMPDFAAP